MKTVTIPLLLVALVGSLTLNVWQAQDKHTVEVKRETGKKNTGPYYTTAVHPWQTPN